MRRLRVATVAAVERVWRSLGGYDEVDVGTWLVTVVPLILAAQRLSVRLTDAYLARAMERRPLGLDPTDLIGAAVRNGTTPEVVYRRPFVTMWKDLGEQKLWQEAFDAALARAQAAAAIDTQLSMRATADAVNEADPNMFGFRRAVDVDPCKFCRLVDGAYVKSANAMPLHNHCGCSLEPLTKPHPRAAFLPSGVAVHEHGELGSILVDPAHDFTTKAEALH
jgi:hypothetical protein